MNKHRIIQLALIVVVVTLIGLGLLLRRGSDNVASANLESFAKCLRGKKITMYGAAWCPHCQNEKKAFGDAFQFIPYVECPENTQLCLDKGIRGYPTWELPNDTKLEGEQGLSKLSQVSRCRL